MAYQQFPCLIEVFSVRKMTGERERVCVCVCEREREREGGGGMGE